MAGLQQYNFFPTDLFYPKPSSSSSAAAKPAVLPLQTPIEDLPQQQQQPRSLVKATPSSSSSSLVHTHNKKQQQQQPLIVDHNKGQKGILNWVTWLDQEEEGYEAF